MKAVLPIFFVFFFFFSCPLLKAQFPNPANFNTATNAGNTGTLPIGTNDLNWSAALTNSLGPYVPAKVCGNAGVTSCCWINSPFPNANWISYPHTCTAGDWAEHSCLPGNQDIYYKLNFSLPSTNCGQSVSTPSAYCLSFDFYSDNCVYEIFVNGVLNYLSPSTNSYYNTGYNSAGGVSISLCNNWLPGTNTLIVHVRSGQNPPPTWEALLAQANQTLNTTVGVPYLNVSSTQTNVSCFGGSNGAASVSVNGGSSVTYSWIPSGGTSNVATGLSAGSYSVIVTSGSCTATKTISITQPAAFSFSASPNTTMCPGTTAVLSASGASSYTWSTGASGASVSVGSPGIYTVTAFNASGCASSKTIGVTAGSSPTLSVSGSSAICVGSQAVFTANGATNYTWSTGVQSNSISVSPPSSTAYTVTGTSAGVACPASQTVNLTVNNFLTLSVTGPTAICTGGTAQFTVSGANNYTWSTGSTTNTIAVSPTAATMYSVTGTNTTGCSGTATVQVIVNSLPQISAVNISLCPGGTVTASANGAATYTWSTGALTPSTNITSPGIYSVSGTSSAGCVNSQTMSAVYFTVPVISISGPTAVCSGQSATLVANGASSYTWNTGSTSAIANIPNITSASVFTVHGVDNSTGCSSDQGFTVAIVSPPQLYIIGTPVSCGNSTVELAVSGADSYSWSTGATSPTITVNPQMTTNYVVTGTNAVSGCSNYVNVTVTVSPLPVLSANNATVCLGQPALLVANGATYYQWSNGVGTNTVSVTPLSTSIYTISAYSSSSLCAVTKTVMVTVLSAPQLTLNTSSVSICKGGGAFLSVTGAQHYLWNTGDTLSQLFVSPGESTVYSVHSTDNNSGCTSTRTVHVYVLPLPDIKIIAPPQLCDGAQVKLTASGGHSYVWQDGSTQNTLPVVVQENALYVLLGSNSETGCSNIDSIRVGNSGECCDIYIPNSFSPNEDNLNEVFKPVTVCHFKEYKMYIFDRWGEQIFVTDDITVGWNGYLKGKLCPEDVYVYLVRGIRKETGVKPLYEKTGHVSLMK